MADYLSNIEELVDKDKTIIDIWGLRRPKYEKKYETSVIRVISQFGVKANTMTYTKGKYFGNAYEPYIIAFFIGLYSNKRLPLSEERDDLKDCGYSIEKWGDNKVGDFRKKYSGLRSYIFIALVAKTDIDWIAVDKGDIKVSIAVTALINTMEEYANYGFAVMEEKLRENSSYFYSHRAFLDMFLQLTKKEFNFDDETESPEEL
ncbi:MAG: glycoside hydrolase family 15 [Prevotella sp.]|nr:glycoside hydrolase family 15 [Prevotella sp.]